MYRAPEVDTQPSGATAPSHAFGVDLAIVPISAVLPHEVPDSGRVERLGGRLRADGVLRDPIMVGRIAGEDDFILLDGTNRRAALLELGCGQVLAQIVDYEDRHCVHLLTWAHLVDMGFDELVALAASVDGLEATDVPGPERESVFEEKGAVAAIHRHDQTRLLVGTGERPDLMLALVKAYESRMRREAWDEGTIDEKLEEIRSRPGGHDSVLVTFPRLTRHDVVKLARGRTPIPAGVTRHVMRCGRALRVNVPIDWLHAGLSSEEATRALENHLAGLRPRRYLEPTVLFDS